MILLCLSSEAARTCVHSVSLTMICATQHAAKSPDVRVIPSNPFVIITTKLWNTSRCTGINIKSTSIRILIRVDSPNFEFAFRNSHLLRAVRYAVHLIDSKRSSSRVMSIRVMVTVKHILMEVPLQFVPSGGVDFWGASTSFKT